jgi:hypothetical protein
MTPDERVHIWDRRIAGIPAAAARARLGLESGQGNRPAHQGTVAVSSTLGEGFRFTLQFPASPPHGH